MNNAKIAAALHALADAFADGGEEQPAKTTKGKGKAAADAAPAATAAAAQQPAPAAPSVTKDQLNKVVLAVAAKGRDKAEAILAKFGAKNTVTLPVEQYQAVFDAFEEELAKIDAAAAQAPASLV